MKQETLEEFAERKFVKECMGIINQLFDLAEISVKKRQEINDVADKYLQKQISTILKEQDKNKFSEEEVELVANEMVNWAIDNIGNPFPQSGKKFDEVIAKFKNK